MNPDAPFGRDDGRPAGSERKEVRSRAPRPVLQCQRLRKNRRQSARTRETRGEASRRGGDRRRSAGLKRKGTIPHAFSFPFRGPRKPFVIVLRPAASRSPSSGWFGFRGSHSAGYGAQSRGAGSARRHGEGGEGMGAPPGWEGVCREDWRWAPRAWGGGNGALAHPLQCWECSGGSHLQEKDGLGTAEPSPLVRRRHESVSPLCASPSLIRRRRREGLLWARALR